MAGSGRDQPESVVLIRWRPRRCRGRSQVSFFELMAQLFGELDFGIAREAGRGFYAGIDGVRSDLDHGDRLHAYHVPKMKCPVKTNRRCPARAGWGPFSVRIHNSAARIQGYRPNHWLRCNESTEGSTFTPAERRGFQGSCRRRRPFGLQDRGARRRVFRSSTRHRRDGGLQR